MDFTAENFNRATCKACGKKKSSEFNHRLPSFSNMLVSFLPCTLGRGDLTPKSGNETEDRQTESNQSQLLSGCCASQEISQLLSTANGTQLYFFHDMSLVSADTEFLFEF